MALKVGHRVTVLPGVSPRVDPGSINHKTPKGVDRSHCVGKRGEVIEIDDDGNCLVDDQIKDGQPRGECTMREWFRPEELEVG